MPFVVAFARALLVAGDRETAVSAARYLFEGGETRADRYAHALFYGVLLVIGVGVLPTIWWPLGRVAYEALKWLVWGGAVGLGFGTLLRERAALVEFARKSGAEQIDDGVCR